MHNYFLFTKIEHWGSLVILAILSNSCFSLNTHKFPKSQLSNFLSIPTSIKYNYKFCILIKFFLFLYAWQNLNDFRQNLQDGRHLWNLIMTFSKHDFFRLYEWQCNAWRMLDFPSRSNAYLIVNWFFTVSDTHLWASMYNLQRKFSGTTKWLDKGRHTSPAGG